MTPCAWLAALAAVAVGLASPAGAESTEAFAVGQRWHYQTRPQEPESTLVVGKVESSPELGDVVHVSVFGLAIVSPQAPGGVTREIQHMPFAASALRGSVTRRAGIGAAPARFEGGYAQWRAAVDAGKGGVYTLSVRDAVQTVEDAINGRRR
jgi:hypothetical protein